MTANSSSSQLFEAYKSVGLVSGTVPHLVRYVDQINKIQIVTAVGRSFLVFNERLQLIETCVAHSSDISLLACDSRFLFTAASDHIFAWKHGHRWKVKQFRHDQCGRLHLMTVLGGQLLAVDHTNHLFCWDISSETLVSRMSFASFAVTALLHPATYINKLLLGSRQGTLQLWNLARQKLVYQFAGFGSPVCALSQAPALHVVAIGHQSGLIVLHHLQQDASLMKLRQEFGPADSITFRTDDADTSPPLMVSSSQHSGHLAIWNLDQQRLERQLAHWHFGSIAGISFISKQPLLVSNSQDNSIKVAMFEELSAGSNTVPRSLFHREGHRGPSTRVRFYQDTYVLSAGLDATLRSFSVHSERLNRSLGAVVTDTRHRRRASRRTKAAVAAGEDTEHGLMPPITELALADCPTEWDNVAACHRDSPLVTTWNLTRMSIGKHKLLHSRFQQQQQENVQALSLWMSACGNFVLVGYNTGHLDRWNVQSGIHRANYAVPGQQTAHQGQLRAVVSDALNQMVVSGGSDRRCRVWRFRDSQLLGTLRLPDAVNRMAVHSENQLVAIALDNFDISVLDVQGKKIVRCFRGHGNRITDMTFDAACRRLLVSSLDGRIYVWDMLSGQLVDLLRTETPCMSLSLSSDGQFLATAHVDRLGICLWANRLLYTRVSLKPLTQRDVEEAAVLQLPLIRSDVPDESTEDESGKPNQSTDTERTLQHQQYRSPEQIAEQLVTLANAAGCQWRNLLNLDLIRKRNKPREPIQKPEHAPFFLPPLQSWNTQEAGPPPTEDCQPKPETAVVAPRLLSPMVRSLHEHSQQGRLEEFFQHRIKPMTPAQLETEIRSLDEECTGTPQYMAEFLDMLTVVLASNRDFEMVNGHLALLLKLHCEAIGRHQTLHERAAKLAEALEMRWPRLQSAFDQSMTVVNFLRNALI